jgi:hypothetical protein
MPSIDVPAGARVMLVRRGNMETVLPIDRDVFTGHPASSVAQLIAITFVRLQAEAPDRCTEPIRLDDTPLALRVIGRDSALEPHLPLSIQTDGLWEIRELPVTAQSDITARLPVCAFELIDVQRPSILLA